MTSPVPRPGAGPLRVVLDRFRLESPMAYDLPFASSFLARDTILGRSVQVVLVDAGPLNDSVLEAAGRAALVTGTDRFQRVLHAGEDGGQAVLVLDLPTGRSLIDLAPMAEPAGRAIVMQVAEAIEVARERGLNHGMLRPACVWIEPGGNVRISGLAWEAVLVELPPVSAQARAERDARGLMELYGFALAGQLFHVRRSHRDPYPTSTHEAGPVFWQLIPADLRGLAHVTLTEQDTAAPSAAAVLEAFAAPPGPMARGDTSPAGYPIPLGAPDPREDHELTSYSHADAAPAPSAAPAPQVLPAPEPRADLVLPESESTAAPEPEPGPGREPEPEPVLEDKQELAPEPEPKPVTAPEQDSEPAPAPEPEPAPDPATRRDQEPKSKPVPAPEPGPEAGPEPEPVPAPPSAPVPQPALLAVRTVPQPSGPARSDTPSRSVSDHPVFAAATEQVTEEIPVVREEVVPEPMAAQTSAVRVPVTPVRPDLAAVNASAAAGLPDVTEEIPAIPAAPTAQSEPTGEMVPPQPPEVPDLTDDGSRRGRWWVVDSSITEIFPSRDE